MTNPSLPPLPANFTDDNGHGMPSHRFSRKLQAWIPTPENYRRREDGLISHIRFKDEWHQVPPTEQIEEWVMDSVCETPEGDTVEPDHPHSWLWILKLI